MMKAILPMVFVLLATAPLGLSEDARPMLAVLEKGNEAAAVKPVQDYHDVLAHIPAEYKTTSPKAWTDLQREKVNDALKGALIDNGTTARLVLEVTNIADWGGWTFHADIPNKEGYPIRVFGKFGDDWKEKFTALKKGQTVLLIGTLNTVTYRQLWGKFTLSICLKDCTFTKAPPTPAPNVKL